MQKTSSLKRQAKPKTKGPAKKKVMIVGAGLSGLTAAINLAREGFEVEVLEKEKRIGGAPVFRPDPAGSPFDFQRLANYIGFDISPTAKFIEESYQVVWGKKYPVRPRRGVPLYMVERGARPTSIDSFLYNMATDLGVKVKFGHPLITQADFEKLPPNSIVATGFDTSPYHLMGITYDMVKTQVAKCKVNHDKTSVTIYMGDYTGLEYAFSSTINGIGYAFIFYKGRTVGERELSAFAKDIKIIENMDLGPWEETNLVPVPHKEFLYPRLFEKDMIIAGSLAGTIEPFLGFGMHGALVSGKIASIAVTDRARALKEHEKLTSLFPVALGMKNWWDRTPAWLRRRFCAFSAVAIDYLPDSIVNYGYRLAPGYGRLPVRFGENWVA